MLFEDKGVIDVSSSVLRTSRKLFAFLRSGMYRKNVMKITSYNVGINNKIMTPFKIVKIV